MNWRCVVAARHGHFHVQILKRPPVLEPQVAVGLTRMYLPDRHGLARAQLQHDLPGPEAQYAAPDAPQLSPERFPKGIVHGHHRENHRFVAEEQPHLRHEVGLGPVVRDARVDLDLRRREEGVDGVELPVEIEMDAWQ